MFFEGRRLVFRQSLVVAASHLELVGLWKGPKSVSLEAKATIAGYGGSYLRDLQLKSIRTTVTISFVRDVRAHHSQFCWKGRRGWRSSRSGEGSLYADKKPEFTSWTIPFRPSEFESKGELF